MPIFDLFSKNFTITYRNSLISKAAFLVLILGVFTVIIPFIIAYNTGDFWLKRHISYEQPFIKLKKDYLFLATTNNFSYQICCSTVPNYQPKELAEVCSMVKMREVDLNFDWKTDKLEISVRLNLPKNTFITSVRIIVPIDYKLERLCFIHLESAIIIEQFLTFPIQDYTVIGDLRVRQSVPFYCHKHKINKIYDYPIFKDTDEIDHHIFQDIIMDYSQRNLSTRLTNLYTNFLPGQSQIFNFQLKINNIENKIYYEPGLWQIMKWAWIQYYLIYIIVSYVITKLKAYIFNKRLVLFYEHNPLKKQS